jgi:hypothetical protein
MNVGHGWRLYRDAFDWRVLPLVALVILAAATSFGYHRILLAQRLPGKLQCSKRRA